MNVKVTKSQIFGKVKYSDNKSIGLPIIRIDYHGQTLVLTANEPLNLPEGQAEKSGKKAIVFAYVPGRNYGRVMDFGEYGAEDYKSGASEEKREAYLHRAMNIKDGKGRRTCFDKYSPNYWSIFHLWEYIPRLNSKYIKPWKDIFSQYQPLD